MSSPTITAPTVPQLSPPPRILMGPGPSDVHPRVLAAMSLPLVGHLDPEFIRIKAHCLEVFQREVRRA